MNRFSCLTGIPEVTKGLVRELRVRWMLEELGLPYEPVIYPHPETKKEEYLKLQPFGQVPYFADENIHMFETGAILIYLAMKYKKFLSSDPIEQAHTFQWMFAAQSSLEPWLFHHFLLNWDPDGPESMKEKARQLMVDRLGALSRELGDKNYLGKDFSIADITMTLTLKTASTKGFLENYKNLSEYLARNEGRPAFKRALAGHLKLYEN